MPSPPRPLLFVAAALAIAAVHLSDPGQRAASGTIVLPSPYSSPVPGSGLGTPIVKAGFFDWLFGSRRGERPRQRREDEQRYPRADAVPPGEDDDRDDGDAPRPRYSGTFKTLCVRLCDGFYFPISFSATPDRFPADARQCEQSCPKRSRLFLHRNPGEAAEAMVDLEGKPYRDLPTASLYQTQYVADCTCRGNPWDKEALERHQAYAQSPPPKPADKFAERRNPDSINQSRRMRTDARRRDIDRD